MPFAGSFMGYHAFMGYQSLIPPAPDLRLGEFDV